MAVINNLNKKVTFNQRSYMTFWGLSGVNADHGIDSAIINEIIS
jgi:hypothetical protein